MSRTTGRALVLLAAGVMLLAFALLATAFTPAPAQPPHLRHPGAWRLWIVPEHS